MRRTLLAVMLGLCGSTAGAQEFGLHVPARNESLRLVRHDVQLDVRHPVVKTVLTQEYENPYGFNLEAFFSYPVPPAATVTGLALWVNGERREARMLERQKAREIYEGIVSQKRDPALLEKAEGNGFRIRIFPVLARSRQRVELTFVQPVEQQSDGTYHVTLRRPPGSTIHALRVGVVLQAGFPLRWARIDGYRGTLRPDASGYTLPMPTAERSFDREIALRYQAAAPLERARVLATRARSSTLFVAEVPRRATEAQHADLALLVDASASMAPHLPRVRHLVRELLGMLGPEDRLAFVPFGLLPPGPTKLSAANAAMKRFVTDEMDELEPRGGTAFVPAFRQALATGARHVVLVTDGATRYHQAELEHLLRVAYDQGDVAVSVILLQRGDNEEPLADLARATAGLFQRLDASDPADVLARQVARHRATRQTARISGPGEVHVIHDDGARVLVAGEIAEGEAREATLTLGRERVTLPLPALEKGGEPLAAVGGLFGAAAIERRMREIKLFGESEERRREVVALSQRHSVMSEYTALLATETDADYDRPTSGRTWQRTPGNMGDNLPSTHFQSTPEPHEWAMIGLGLLLLWLARRRRAAGTVALGR